LEGSLPGFLVFDRPPHRRPAHRIPRLRAPVQPSAAGPRSSSAHTVLHGTGPSSTPHRSANSATSNSPRPDSASEPTPSGARTGSRSPRVSVTSIRSVADDTTARVSRKLRPATRPCNTAFAASSATRDRAGSKGSPHDPSCSTARSRASRAPRRVAESGTENRSAGAGSATRPVTELLIRVIRSFTSHSVVARI